MDTEQPRPTAPPSRSRVLVVADWSADAQAIVSACERHDKEQSASFGLIVPGWLHGLDWVGDSTAGLPCARRQLERIKGLPTPPGLSFAVAGVRDPDVVAAICDATADWPADELLLCPPARRLDVAHVLDLSHRAQRLTGLPVRRIAVPAPAAAHGGAWLSLRGGHCAIECALAA